MKIIDCDKDFIKPDKRVSIALGNFDGLHLGHQKLIKRAIEISQDEGLISSVLLFKQNSKSLTQDKEARFLTSLDDKIQLLEEMRIDLVYIKDFDQEFMHLRKQTFLVDFLLKEMNVGHLVCGADYSFGYMAEGNTDDLKNMKADYDYSLDILDYVNFDGDRISSTRIREDISLGKVEEAHKMLGRPYKIKGTVVRGEGRGRNLGFATANIKLNFPYLLPKSGVYLTEVAIDNMHYYAMTDIGYNPTFKKTGSTKIESNIFDFDNNIYGQDLELNFLRFERDDRSFSSAEDLINQLNKDEKLLRKWALEYRQKY